MQQNADTRQEAWRDRATTARGLTWQDRLGAFRSLGRLFVLLWHTNPALTLATIALRICRGGLPLLALWIPKLILDAIVFYLAHRPTSNVKILYLLALELGVAVTNDVMTRLNTLCDSLLADQFTNRIRRDVIQHAATLDLAAFENPSFYDSLERVRNQGGSRMEVIAALLNLAQNLVSLAVLSFGLVVFSPWLLILLAAGLIPPFLGESRFTTLTYSSLFRWTPYRRLLEYLCYLGASGENAKEIKLFGLGSHLAEAYESVSKEIYEDHKSIAVKRASFGSVLSVLCTLSYYSAYLMILLKTLAGLISIGTFAFLTASFTRSRFYIERIMSGFAEISDQAIYLRDLFSFFNTQPIIRSVPKARLVPRPPQLGFEFRHVSFTYPGSNHPTLHDITFRLAPHGTLALVGENGAGKTTLVKLLLRLYDPTEGEILLDGINLKEYDLDDFRNASAALFQDYTRYNMKVSDNIGFGDIDKRRDLGKLATAAKRAGATELIDRLPNRYEQMLGTFFEGGIPLSGGEWQKLALARAHMKDAHLMILDEPTASLDARAEYEVFNRFSELVRGRMLVLISHRFSTVRMADEILVLKEGVVRERGKHSELILLGQHYAELFELQASAYR
jgi:ATP-binding cassette subfamily B protein